MKIKKCCLVFNSSIVTSILQMLLNMHLLVPILSLFLNSCLFPRIHVHWHQQQEAQGATFREPEYNVPPLLTDETWRPSCMVFRWVRKHKLGRGRYAEIWLLVKFLWILFGSFRREVENDSPNQRPGQPSWFSDQPAKHKLGRGRWGLSFLSSSVEFFTAVSEEKSKMWKENDNGWKMRDQNTCSALEPWAQVHKQESVTHRRWTSDS